MTDENRRRLTDLVAGATNLAAAAQLVREARGDIARSGLLPWEDVQKISDDLNAYFNRVAHAIGEIPST